MAELKMDKNYNPKEFEDKIYDKWMEKKYFEANVNEDKEAFSIVLPPPNITGQLHMGHALDHTLQDVIIRFKRMQGYEALWLPGTDHASIATEVKVLNKIKEDEGKTKDDLTREEFLEKAWQWRDIYGRKIVNQMKKLGNSCDWSKERFTMDDGCNDAVTEVFINLHKKGLIYKGNRIVNWCPDCETTLSEAEVEHEEKQGNFWHIKYMIKDSDEYLEIATTRPETMLGDTAIAVNPSDERYSHFIGKTAILPIVNREIPIIGDHYVDTETGTGALKVTPAHDPNDFLIGKRHDLEEISVINKKGIMNENALHFDGMDRYDCRKAIVKELKEDGYLIEVKAHQHNVGVCYRCNTVIEPRISKQWFVAMEKLAKPALEAVENKDMEFIPERFVKIYNHWLENIRDWCISRQLWWGHRIPAYYCQDCDETIIAKEEPKECTKCGSANLKQDPDVLDTWFSSALWPFSTLGWPEDTKELDYFYPTNVLVTGYDIIFFWVVRMMFSGLEQMGEVPFKHTFIHGLVRDAQGRKMSKSLGNGVDPLEVIGDYGADALRFMLMTGNSPGNDMKFLIEKVEASRNFANKIWNASRFVLMGLDEDMKNFELNDSDELNVSDEWILSRLNEVTRDVTENLNKYELGLAADKIYEFVWNEYCDWYIELAKKRLYGEDLEAKATVQKVLITVLKDILKFMHPFMPFITEEIWSHMPEKGDALIVSDWPTFDENAIHEKSINQMNGLMDAIKNIRIARAKMDVSVKRKAKLLVVAEGEVKENIINNKQYLIDLASCSEVVLADKSDISDDAVSVVIDGGELFMPLADLINFKAEIERLTEEKNEFISEIKRAKGKLSNKGFVNNAPDHLVKEEEDKIEKYEDMLKAVEERIDSLKEKL
ncbi:MAG TPA: valine--tRNA ligase [Clostridia bacterium]|nr:valine--tRNA ligase [Clostridia bacterium]